MGYSDAARELINSLGDDKVDNYNLLMTLFYEIVSDKKAVADFYIKYGTKGHLYWIKQNLGLYRFSGSEAVIIKSNIENIKINNTMSLTEINSMFEILQKHVIGFQKIFHDNIFLSYMGIYGVLKQRASLPIIPTHSLYMTSLEGRRREASKDT